MQFIELYRIDTKLHTDRRFHRESLAVLKSNKLYGNTLQFIQYVFGKIFKKQLRIRLCQSVRASFPSLAFSTEVNIIKIVITIIHQISLESSAADSLDIFGHES